MRGKAVLGALSLIAVAMFLGATVMREPIARAAATLPSFIVANGPSNPVPVRELGRTINVIAEPTLVSVGQEGFVAGPFETSDCRSLELFVKRATHTGDDPFYVALAPVVAGKVFGNSFLGAGFLGETEIEHLSGAWTWQVDGMPLTAPAVRVQITFGPLNNLTEPQLFEGAWLYCG